jgi:hypothetical protein
MLYEAVKDKFVWYLTFSLQGNEITASEIYTDDAVVEFPQSGERFRGKEHFIPWRSAYPAAMIEFEVRAIRGEGDMWAVEGRVRYGDDDFLTFVDLLHFRGDLVDRETIYIANAFPADEARAKSAERSDPDSTDGLPIRLRSGD